MRERIMFTLATLVVILLAPILVVLATIRTVCDVIVHGPKAFKEEK